MNEKTEQKFIDTIREMSLLIDALLEENEALRNAGDTLFFSSKNPLPSIDPDRLAMFLIGVCGPDKKISMIKELRAITNWGLKQSKDFVEQFCYVEDKQGFRNIPRDFSKMNALEFPDDDGLIYHAPRK